MPEGSEDDIVTRELVRAQWLPPVVRREELPTESVRDGTLCYVEGEGPHEEEVWVFRDGTWSILA